MSQTEPLGLPRGTVRAVLTVLLLVVLAVTLFVPVVAGAGGIRDGLLALAVMSIKDYFNLRAAQNAEDGPALAKPSVG